MWYICIQWNIQFSSVAQSCPTLCDPMDCSLPGSSIHGIFQARVLEWAAIQFSSLQSLSRVRPFATPWTVAYQAPPSMGFSRQEYWSGCHAPHVGFPIYVPTNSVRVCQLPYYPYNTVSLSFIISVHCIDKNITL